MTDLRSRSGVPAERDDGWPVASADDSKLIDRQALCKMVDRLAASPDTNVHAVLVARHGELVFEHYFNGSDEVHGCQIKNIAFDVDTLNDMPLGQKTETARKQWVRLA